MQYNGDKMKRRELGQGGFTLVELTVVLVIFTVVAISFFGLFISLVHSTIIAKRQAVALTLATNQMENLKSLPYDTLAIAGGAIYSSSPLPASSTQKLDGVTYTITTSINYVDDAYDGCTTYPSQALKELYCRNYPPPSGSPAVDGNPQDYKIVHVTVTDSSNLQLAAVDTQISARVSETASTTGALFVNVIDANGNPISGATVGVVNNTVTPAANVSDTTDVNGIAIFYGLPPDSGTDYVVTASKSGYSTLSTISASGTLQPTYPSQKILSQQSSYVTLTLNPQDTNSLVLEATDTSGNPLSGAKIYVKGGYKKYTQTTDHSYYYDGMSPSDIRPTTDANGLAALTNLAPGAYVFCGDSGATSCTVGGVTYYLVAAVPYGGSAFSPVSVPLSGASGATYTYGASTYVAKVRLVLTSNSSFPRIATISPSNASLSDGNISSFPFTVTGTNLNCASTPDTCATTISLKQGGTTFPASCTGNTSPASSMDCTVDLSAASSGNTQLVISYGGTTVTLPASPMQGGILVIP